MILLRLAWHSLLARRITVGLTVVAMALSVMLFAGVEKVRTGARDSFAGTISGTDLIVGARSGAVQLLLYSVFRIGNATNNVTWESYQDIAARPEVDWIVPISLGDSHRQFRVMGTSAAFFDRYAYRGGRTLIFAEGRPFGDVFDAVIGADVAATLGYDIGTSIVVAHGVASFVRHENQPFRVAGILAKTGTPVDRTVLVSMEGIEAMHVDWRGGAAIPGQVTSPDEIRRMELAPEAVTAALVGVRSRIEIFALQRAINQYPEEPLLAILPGVALQELWSLVGVAERALVAVSAMVVVTSLLGMAAMIFAGLSERRREMAILRTIGARPRVIVGLLATEAMLMAAAAAILGLVLLYAALVLAQPVIDARFGLYLPIEPPSARDGAIVIAVILAAAVVSLFPAWRAYRLSLADGMTPRI